MDIQAVPILRPLRLGELLDQAIRLYRRNFLTFVGIIAIVYVPLMVLQTASSALLSSSFDDIAASTSPDEIFTNYAYLGGMLSSFILIFFQVILLQGIATGALTRAVADNYLGKKASILDAYRGIGKSWLTLIGALLFLGIVSIAISIWWVVPCIGWFTGLGMLAFLTAAVNPLVAPVVVMERQGAISAVQRAWNLSRRRFWQVLGTVFVLYLFSLIVVNGPVTIVNVLLIQAVPALDDPTMQVVLVSVIQAIVALIFTLIYYPLQMTAFTLIYFDLRVRTEGLDIAFQAANPTDAAALAQVMAAPVSQTNERLVTGADLGNFAILTLAAAGIYIFFFTFIMGSAFFLFSLMGIP